VIAKRPNTRTALSGRGAFFKLQVYERAGIALAEVYERVGKSVISVSKMPQMGNRCILWLRKSGKNVLVL